MDARKSANPMRTLIGTKCKPIKVLDSIPTLICVAEFAFTRFSTAVCGEQPSLCHRNAGEHRLGAGWAGEARLRIQHTFGSKSARPGQAPEAVPRGGMAQLQQQPNGGVNAAAAPGQTAPGTLPAPSALSTAVPPAVAAAAGQPATQAQPPAGAPASATPPAAQPTANGATSAATNAGALPPTQQPTGVPAPSQPAPAQQQPASMHKPRYEEQNDFSVRRCPLLCCV